MRDWEPVAEDLSSAIGDYLARSLQAQEALVASTGDDWVEETFRKELNNAIARATSGLSSEERKRVGNSLLSLIKLSESVWESGPGPDSHLSLRTGAA